MPRPAEAGGLAAEVAAEIAFYLAQAHRLRGADRARAAAFAESGRRGRLPAARPAGGWLPLLTGPERRHTLLWSLTDGFAWYRGSFVGSVAGLLDVPQFGSPPAA